MSTTETKRTLAWATADAEAFRALFPASCYHRWEIAGSIRRHRLEISDAEHIIIPRFGEVGDGGLFNEKKTVNLLWHRAEDLVAAGVITKHVYGEEEKQSNRWGPKYRGSDFRGMNHEIFLADQNNWGSVLAIRTGPADLSRNLVIGLQRNGFVNSGGYVRDKHRWSCKCGWRGNAPYVPRNPGDPAHLSAVWINGTGDRVAICPGCRQGDKLNADIVPCTTEQEFFIMAGVQYVHPAAR